MRLRSVEVIPYALPFREPYVTARGALSRREMVLLRIRDLDGIEGLGEAVPLSLRGGARLETVVAELEALGELDELCEEAVEGMALSAPARCAALCALADLGARAQATGSGDASSPVPCNATLVAGEPAAVAEEALRWWEEGYRTFKLKLGAGEDVAQVAAVREVLGGDAQLRIDANAAWDLETARALLTQLEPLGIELAEQPVARMEEAARLARSTSIPLAGDESIVSRADAEEAVSLGAFSLTGIKLSKVGGHPEAMRIAEVMPCYVSSALDGPVGIAAGARLAGAVSSTKANGLATQRLFAATVASVECELHEGMLHPPAGPGLGVEIDEDALRAHRL